MIIMTTHPLPPLVCNATLEMCTGRDAKEMLLTTIDYDDEIDDESEDQHQNAS